MEKHTIRISGYLQSLPVKAGSRRKTSWPSGLEHRLTLLKGSLRFVEDDLYTVEEDATLRYQHHGVYGHLIEELSWEKSFSQGDSLKVIHY